MVDKRPLQESRTGWLFIALYALSGLCAMAAELAWMNRLALLFGGTLRSACLVSVAFFLAGAAGGLLALRRAPRMAHPLRAYAVVEIAGWLLLGIAWLVSKPLFSLIPAGAWLGTGRLPVQFAATLLYTGPFFAAQGMLFPLLGEYFIRRGADRVKTGGIFYAGNTLGAAAGVLLGGLLLPVSVGYGRAVLLMSAAGSVIGLIAYAGSRRAAPREETPAPPDRPAAAHGALFPAYGILVVVLSGFLATALQGLHFYYARLIFGSSVFAFQAALFAFIAHLGIGAWIASFWRKRENRTALPLGFALCGSGLLLVVYPAAMEAVCAFLPMTGTAPPRAATVFLWTLIGSAPWTIPAGMVFPLAWEHARPRMSHHGAALGLALFLNKTAAAAGLLCTAFLWMPRLGSAPTALLLGSAYFAAGLPLLLRLSKEQTASATADRPQPVPAGLPRTHPLRPQIPAWSFLLLAALSSAVIMTLPRFYPIGEKILYRRDTLESRVEVRERESDGSRRIVLNNQYVLNGTMRALSPQKNESWIPLFLHANPKDVLFIGMGSGISAAAALDFPIDRLTAVELIPEVADAARLYFGEWSGALFRDPRADIVIEDGRFLLEKRMQFYDLILCDLLLPTEESAARLYSLDFLAAARERLKPGGLYCLWLPLHQLNERTAGIIAATFCAAFPHAVLIRNNLNPRQPVWGLLGSMQPIPFSESHLSMRRETPEAKAVAGSSFFLRSPAHAAMLFAGDVRAASAYFQTFPVTTDDLPLFAWEAAAARKHMRGLQLLNIWGTRFLSPDFPSCDIGATSPARILAGLRAGNHLFAAATAADLIPGSRHQDLRLRQAEESLATARALLPEADLKAEDLFFEEWQSPGNSR